MRARAVD